MLSLKLNLFSIHWASKIDFVPAVCKSDGCLLGLGKKDLLNQKKNCQQETKTYICKWYFSIFMAQDVLAMPFLLCWTSMSSSIDPIVNSA